MHASLAAGLVLVLVALLTVPPLAHGRSPLAASSSPSVEEQLAQRQRLAALRQQVETLKAGAFLRDVLTAELTRLEELLASRVLRCNPIAEVQRLEQDLAAALKGEQPYLRPGVHRLAYRSKLDGRLHPFAVYVPASYPRGALYPLIVMLHGMRGTPLQALGRLFGVADQQLGSAQLTCARPSLGEQRAIVVAPDAFGDTLYRLAGEQDVDHVVHLMLRLYKQIDRRRITITGLSMGGTGAVEIALQRPHLYAGALALCGYYDRQLDSNIRDLPLLPWEQQVMSVHSPVEWARNGRHLPLVLVHGEEDGPARARALESRYRELGYSVSLELYPRGHDVWVPGYEKGRAFDLLSKFRQGPSPRVVSFVSGRSRIRQAYWVVIERWQDYSRWARVEAKIVDDQHLELKTENIAELRLNLPAAYVTAARPLQLAIDGERLEVAGTKRRSVVRLALARAAGRWTSETAPPTSLAGLVKRPGLAGPISDIYYEPVVVVYGTRGGQATALRRVAQELAAYGPYVDLRYPVLPDYRFSAAEAASHSVILVGNEQTNSVLARMKRKLPIHITDEQVQVGKRSYRRPNLGATFIYPNPEAPTRYMLVVGGTTPGAYRLRKYLPIYLPDYLVYDDGLGTERRRTTVVGTRTIVEAGFFDGAWQLPGSKAAR